MNRTPAAYYGLCLGVAFSLSFSAGASAQTDSEAPVYKPPVRGAPASRVGGGSRSVGTELPRMYVLAPADIGFTTKAKPDLYWFVSGPTEAKAVFSIYTDDPNKPLLEQNLAAVTAPGIQRIRLSDYGLELQPKTEYRWRVTLINEAANRQARAVAGGAIQRTNAWPKLQSRLQSAPQQQAVVYAEEGLWYDAIESLSASAGANPKARAQLAGLLNQVGLTEASQYEAAGK